MPASWPLEALKAQAVTARTYALATRNPDGEYDLYPDTRSQVYRGVTARGRAQQRRRERHRRAHPHLRRRAGGDLLLLHLRRPHREHPVLVRRLAQQAVARGRARPLRLPFALPPLARSRSRTAQLTRALGSRGTFRKPQGAQARNLAADRPGAGDRQPRHHHHQRSRRSGRASACATPGCASRACRPRPAPRTARPVGPRGGSRRASRRASASIHGSFDPAPRAHRLVVERRMRRALGACRHDPHRRPRPLPHGRAQGPASTACRPAWWPDRAVRVR